MGLVRMVYSHCSWRSSLRALRRASRSRGAGGAGAAEAAGISRARIRAQVRDRIEAPKNILWLVGRLWTQVWLLDGYGGGGVAVPWNFAVVCCANRAAAQPPRSARKHGAPSGRLCNVGLAAGQGAGGFCSVDGVDGAGDELGVVGGQEGEKGGDFFGHRVAAKGDFLVDRFEHSVGVFGALHGGQDVSGGDGVDSYFGREFEGHGFGEFDDCGFGGVVVGVKRVADDAVGGGGLEDDAAALLDHVAGGGLGDVENAGQVDGDYFVPFIGRDVEEIVADADAGVVDEDVDSAHRVGGLGEGVLYLIEIADIGV